MHFITIEYFKTKIGEFIIGSYNNKICIFDYKYRKMRFSLNEKIKKQLNSDFQEGTNKVHQEAKEQLLEYIEGKRTEFDLPLLLVGTDFQKSVWEALLKIKFGEVSSYLNIAKNINNEKAVRAVANANASNSIAIIIPCHRIIGSNNELGGYGGGIPLKKRLLKLEGVNYDFK